MAIELRGVQRIQELMDSVVDAPDFSFLSDWRPDLGSTFFPRLNNSPLAEKKLTADDRKKIRVAIEAITDVDQLVNDTSVELLDSKNGFSNSISVFHRDGEVSVIAIPVTAKTKRHLGGFLFARDIWELPNASKFIEDLQFLGSLTGSAEGYLRWRWWPTKKDVRELNRKHATQLLLAATDSSNRNIHHIAELVENRSALTSGKQEPALQDWQRALISLDSLKELPKDAVISTLDLENAPELKAAMRVIEEAFDVRDSFITEAQVNLESLIKHRLESHLDNLSLDEFAKKVRGRGFALKRLIELHHTSTYGFTHNSSIGDYVVPSVGDIIRLHERSPQFFHSATVKASLQLIDTYKEDQRRLLGYPRLSDTDAVFEEFMRTVYRYYLEQQRPYPVRAQFEALRKLLDGDPLQLHLVARNEEAIKKIIGSVESYLEKPRLQALSARHEEPTVDQAREFFRENPATYQSTLSSLGLHSLTLEQISGFLAEELTGAIRDIEIDLSGMRSPLRSYQLFGVQYALRQKRVILGDEPGLGKTVTALALANHLSREGDNRFLVILPLAVLENWRLEILKHSDFTPRVLYGDNWAEELLGWHEHGGIALATFESIQRVNQHEIAPQLKTPQLVIVDEAHFIKNPATKRSKNVLPWVRAAERLMLLTGTPLEHKLSEFEILIHYAQPNLPIPDNKLAYAAFRKAIAPVYLRRNQEDVLHELPELQESREYIELSEADKEYYKRSLKSRDWQRLRRAKILAGLRSSTVQRIQDIVKDSVENDHKVLIFSFYRETLDVLHRVLREDDDYTPLTGSLSTFERQAVVQKFTKAKKPGVLLAQSTAGGTGLNIQAASVVIIVEPQASPALEEQMIRRAFRMGQTKQVRVIRLFGRNTIDERWLEMQESKRKIFDATAAISDAAKLDETSETSASLLEEELKAWGVQ